MKRIWFSVIVILFLCSCSATKTELTKQSPMPITQTETKVSTVSEPPKPDNKQLTEDNVFAFTPKDLIAAIDSNSSSYNSFVAEQPYEDNGYTASWFWKNNGEIKMLAYSELGKENVSVITLIDTRGADEVDKRLYNYNTYLEVFGTRDSAMGDFFLYLENIYQLCGMDIKFEQLANDFILGDSNRAMQKEKGYVEFSKNGVTCRFSTDRDLDYCFFYIYPSEINIDVNSIPLTIKRADDFFTSEDTQAAYDKYLKSHDYTEILGLVDKYINESSPKDTDSAYIIKEKIQPAIDEMQKCELIKDDYSDDIMVYYKGLNKINKANNFITYINNGSLIYRAGFQKNGWVFFDNFKIKADDTIIEEHQQSEVRDVLKGGQILEYADFNIYEKELTALIDANSISIRFYGENDKTYDHTLSTDEVAAIKTINTIYDTNKFLKDLKYRWLIK